MKKTLRLAWEHLVWKFEELVKAWESLKEPCKSKWHHEKKDYIKILEQNIRQSVEKALALVQSGPFKSGQEMAGREQYQSLKVQYEISENANFSLIALKVNVPLSLQLPSKATPPESTYAQKAEYQRQH